MTWFYLVLREKFTFSNVNNKQIAFHKKRKIPDAVHHPPFPSFAWRLSLMMKKRMFLNRRSRPITFILPSLHHIKGGREQNHLHTLNCLQKNIPTAAKMKFVSYSLISSLNKIWKWTFPIHNFFIVKSAPTVCWILFSLGPLAVIEDALYSKHKYLLKLYFLKDQKPSPKY